MIVRELQDEALKAPLVLLPLVFHLLTPEGLVGLEHAGIVPHSRHRSPIDSTEVTSALRLWLQAKDYGRTKEVESESARHRRGGRETLVFYTQRLYIPRQTIVAPRIAVSERARWLISSEGRIRTLRATA